MGEIEAKLKAPFPSARIEWRVGNRNKDGKHGTMFPYVDSRGIQERLDNVFGVSGWKDEYQELLGGVKCKLTCRIKDAEIVKEDGAGLTDVESLKGGISGALKRAAAKLGIGRYLYDLPRVTVELDNGKYFNGKIILPDEALPESERTGNTEIKVEYSSNHHVTAEKPMSDEVKAAMEVVVTDDKYNAGKKMGEIFSLKSLKFLADRGATEEQRKAAQIVYDYKI